MILTSHGLGQGPKNLPRRGRKGPLPPTFGCYVAIPENSVFFGVLWPFNFADMLPQHSPCALSWPHVASTRPHNLAPNIPKWPQQANITHLGLKLGSTSPNIASRPQRDLHLSHTQLWSHALSFTGHYMALWSLSFNGSQHDILQRKSTWFQLSTWFQSALSWARTGPNMAPTTSYPFPPSPSFHVGRWPAVRRKPWNYSPRKPWVFRFNRDNGTLSSWMVHGGFWMNPWTGQSGKNQSAWQWQKVLSATLATGVAQTKMMLYPK